MKRILIAGKAKVCGKKKLRESLISQMLLTRCVDHVNEAKAYQESSCQEEVGLPDDQHDHV